MINYIWLFMIVSGIVAAIAQGRIELVTTAALNGAKDAVAVCFGLISVLVFWLGMMRIAQDAGLLDKLAKLFRPIAKFLFPSVPADHPAMGYILSNISANLFGLGNAATQNGALTFYLQLLEPLVSWIHIPSEVLPVGFLRPITGTGSLAFVESILKTYGPDSFLGKLASTIQGSTDTTLYVITVYFGAVGIRKTLYSLKVGLLADLAGFLAAWLICTWVFL